jgi:hypothetical protein
VHIVRRKRRHKRMSQQQIGVRLRQRRRELEMSISNLSLFSNVNRNLSELELHDAIEDARSDNRILGELLSTALSKARMTSCSCK